LDHLSIGVSDWKASRDWYVGLLGFTVEFEIPQGGACGLGVAAVQDEAGLTLFLEQSAGPILSGQGGYTLQVEDLHAEYERLSAAGAAFISPPGKHYWGYGAVLADPDGHLLYLYDPVSMAQNA
jgi:catechol 2,3-dioxygenase-like lactoylglutathione lyase family enzyme